ncbi:MAG: MBL fold metallo-hydrolase [Pseudomonadales bacterium]
MSTIVKIAALTALFSVSAVIALEPPAHHEQRAYTNPFATAKQGGFFGIIRARLSKQWQVYDPVRDRVPTATPDLVAAGEASTNATVTWVGHATVLIQHQGINVLTDPMFSEYASPVSFAGPKRVSKPAVAIAQLPPIHAVVISHNHYDHLDIATIQQLGNDPVYFVPLGLGPWLQARGIATTQIREMDWWQEDAIRVEGQELQVTATPSQHFSGRGLFDRNKTLWASWRLGWNDFQTWFGGDTGYNAQQFKEIGARLGPFDLGIIPIGAYEPRWFMSTVHVNPEEALLIHRDIGAQSSMGIHWGTFVLAGEGVLTPPAALATARQRQGMDAEDFVAFAVGETRHYESKLKQTSPAKPTTASLSLQRSR